MTSKLPYGTRILLIDEVVHTDKSVPIHYNGSGMYEHGTGKVRHLIVATVGMVNDWSAYEGWADPDMSHEAAVLAILHHGDKIWKDRAIELADDKAPVLVGMRYRL